MARSQTLRTLRDIAAIGRDFAYITRSLVVIKDHLVGPAAEIVAEWIEEARDSKQLSEGQEKNLREKIDGMPDGQDKEDLLELLARSR